MTDLEKWWDSLSKDDRDLFLRSRDTSPLPPEVVQRAQAVGAETVSAPDLADGKGGVMVNWPGATRVFLDEKASEASG